MYCFYYPWFHHQPGFNHSHGDRLGVPPVISEHPLTQDVSSVHSLSPRESHLCAKHILQATPKFTSQYHSLCNTCSGFGVLKVHPCLPQKSAVPETAGSEETSTQSNPAGLLPDLQHQEKTSLLGQELT